MTRSFHQTDGESAAIFPKTCGWRRPRYSETSPPSEEPPMPVSVRSFGDAILAMHKRPHFLQQKFGVTIRAASAKLRCARGRVFAETLFARVVNADDDQRLDAACRR